MYKILRWIGYALTLVSALLIIWAVIGAGSHHSCAPAMAKNGSVCCDHHPKCVNDSVKTDSASCKHHTSCAPGMAKTDSAVCKHNQSCTKVEAMPAHGCLKCQSGILFTIVNSLLLLAIALFIISKHCCCDKCCETKEEKKD